MDNYSPYDRGKSGQLREDTIGLYHSITSILTFIKGTLSYNEQEQCYIDTQELIMNYFGEDQYRRKHMVWAERVTFNTVLVKAWAVANGYDDAVLPFIQQAKKKRTKLLVKLMPKHEREILLMLLNKKEME